MPLFLDAALQRISTLLTDLVASLPNLFVGLIVFIIFAVLARWLSRQVFELMLKTGRSANGATIFQLLTRWIMLAMGALIALSIALPSFSPADLIQILGIGGVAVGFAFRDIFENFLAGLIILLTDAFRIGDQIVVNDLEGTVEKIHTRATTIRTYDGREIILPNAELFTNAVTVNTSSSRRRSQFEVGIGYESDIDAAIRVVKDALYNVDGILPEPEPEVLVSALDSSSVNLKAYWWTAAAQREVVHTQSEVVRAIKYALDENDINIPFPIRTIFLNQENVDKVDALAEF